MKHVDFIARSSAVAIFCVGFWVVASGQQVRVVGAPQVSSSAPLTNTHVWVGNGSGIATDVALSQDCALANTGALTCTKTNNTSFTSLATAAVGQIPATATNDNGCSTCVGFYQESVVNPASPVALTTATTKTMTSTSLAAGDWLASCLMQFLPVSTTTLTNMKAGMSLTNDTFETGVGGTNAEFSYLTTAPFIADGTKAPSLTIPPRRFSLSGSTTVYCVGAATFAVSTLGVFGALRAWRLR